MSTDKSEQFNPRESIAKSAGIISLATLASRLLGFIRDVVIARIFGVYLYAQAFVIAFRIPNLFRDLVGEGASNAAFVPVFSEYNAKHSKEEFWELANIVLNILLVILMSIVLLGIIFSPLIVRMIAPGFIVSPEKLAVTVQLNRIIFPYVLLISLAAYSMGILNSLKHFAIPAFGPCLLNISLIVFVLLFGEGIKGLALGVLIGGVLQLAIQIPILYKKGFRFRFLIKFSHPAVKSIGRLMVPRIFSSSIYHLNNFVDSIFGSLVWIVGEGGVAILYFAYRLIQFPLGVFSNALAQAILPTLSTQALEDNRDNFQKTLSWGLRIVFFAMLPASVGLFVLARPIISTLFGGGRFDLSSVNLTASALSFYSIGLSAYGATRILQNGFFAIKDTKTPAKVASLALIVNIVLNAILMFPLKISGLALATSISGINTFIILFVIFKRKTGALYTRDILVSFMRILIASLCMGVVCYFLSQRYIIFEGNILARFLRLGSVIILGLVSYIGFCFIFRVKELRQLRDWLIKKTSLL